MDESKLAPRLLALLREPRALDVGVRAVPLIIHYRKGVVRSHTIRPGLRARFIYRLTPTVAATASLTELAELTDDADIEAIWFDEEVHTCLERSRLAVGVSAVWDAGYRGDGVKVAILDTGIDRTHPDLRDRIGGGISFVGADFTDDNGHGTHVAGIVAGSGAEAGGRWRGVAPGAMLYVAKVLDSLGAGAMSGVMAGVEWAVEQQVDVINLSLSASGSSDGRDALSMTCNAAVDKGIVLCAASGNTGPGAGTVGAPGAAERVITVGAADRSGGVTDFSGRGPTADGRSKPDICMPGLEIVSTLASGVDLGEQVDSRYTAVSGTSMAVPHAAGVVALLLEARPTLTPAEIKSLLCETAVDLGLERNVQGAGLGRADQAWANLGEPTTPPPPEPPPETNEPRGCLPAFLVPLVGH